jgi:starvation-inducible outer membrane lipoprotein
MRFLFLVLFALLLAGCGEKPQRLEQSSEKAANADQQNDERRQRTLRQGESDRIYQQGTLR